MKICDVVLNSIWYDPRVRKQIIEYVNQGVDVVAIGSKCMRYDEEKVNALPCKTVITRIDEQYCGPQKSFFRKLKRLLLQEKVIVEALLAEKPDIIHANDMNALIPAYRASRKLKCKLIYDAHEIFWANFWDGRHFLYSRYLKMQEWYLSRRVDELVCVSNTAADYFVSEYNIPRPTVITNCALKSEMCISDEKNEGFEIINHGQYYSGRGYDIMVEAIPYLKEYPEIKLAMRGFGNMEKDLRERAAELGDENIRFYPKVLVQELIPMASRAHVGVAISEAICLNFKLSVSNKLFEYASAGLPVIMSDIPEHRYLNEKYQFGIIIPDNKPETFANAVIKMYTDKEFYEKCAENARRLADEINWENEFGKLIELEKRLVSEK